MTKTLHVTMQNSKILHLGNCRVFVLEQQVPSKIKLIKISNPFIDDVIISTLALIMLFLCIYVIYSSLFLLRLASEGIHSILPSPWCSQRLGLRGQTWGSISLSDVIFLLEMKYDVVTHLLYTEMLQEHHSKGMSF